MGRIILVLTAVCLLATFVIISNSSFKTSTSASPKEEEVKKKAEKDRAIKREPSSHGKTAKEGPAKRWLQHSATNPKEVSGSVGVVAISEEENAEDFAHAIVRGEYTPVYSVNSRDSKVVKLLNKGDRVATDLEVTDAKGKWTIVKKGDMTRPGFVLGETLQRGNPTNKNRK